MRLYKRKRNEFRFPYLSALICVYLCPFFFFAHISYAQDFTAETLGDYGNITVMQVSGNYDANKSDGTINSEGRRRGQATFSNDQKNRRK